MNKLINPFRSNLLNTKILTRLCSNGNNPTKESNNVPKKEAKSEKKSSDALDKLNSLLKQMIEEPVSNEKARLNLAKPTPNQKKFEKVASKEKIEKKDVVEAAKQAAESLGGDVKQTESELLTKLLITSQEKSDLTTNLSEIFHGMKIDRTSKPIEHESRSQQVKQILKRRQTGNKIQNKRDSAPSKRWEKATIPIKQSEKIDLFKEKPLGVFTENIEKYDSGPKNLTWEKLLQQDKKLAITHPPKNYFQEMILWTEQGKLWKFPIDNEQGIEKEKDVYFAEHIFLDKHLEPWCPKRGPIRHFMELVCVGLSKNPYLTVEAKREHIEWYKNYFESKQELLKEVGVSFSQDSNKIDGKNA